MDGPSLKNLFGIPNSFFLNPRKNGLFLWKQHKNKFFEIPDYEVAFWDSKRQSLVKIFAKMNGYVGKGYLSIRVVKQNKAQGFW